MEVKGSMVDRHLRPILVNLLAQCTVEQRAFFLWMYPCGVELMTVSKLPRAIE